MLKRTCIVLVFAFALTLGSAVIATPTGAQDQTYYTYVSEWNVPRGQWGAFEKERDQQNATLQNLVADGTILAWGNDANYVHTEDGYTHEDFFIATSRAGILKALDTLRPPPAARIPPSPSTRIGSCTRWRTVGRRLPRRLVTSASARG
jgi:hypothetical protein